MGVEFPMADGIVKSIPSMPAGRRFVRDRDRSARIIS
jgi:hypothetical protein